MTFREDTSTRSCNAIADDWIAHADTIAARTAGDVLQELARYQQAT